MTKIKTEIIEKSVRKALIEDKARADVTSLICIPNKSEIKTTIVAKDKGKICGLHFAKTVFKQMNGYLIIHIHVKEGQTIKPGQKIMTIKGKTQSILGAERTALNFLGYLSGIATQTAAFVKAAPGKTKVLGTRKTTPGNRLIEKYAIAVGGGETHRITLKDMILVKDNHRNAYYKKDKTLTDLIVHIKSQTRKKIEVEVDTLQELKEALTVGVNMILLDNMNTAQLRKAVAMTKRIPFKTRPLLEASGGVTLKNITKIAQTGVDRISTGALTHQQCWLNFSLES